MMQTKNAYKEVDFSKWKRARHYKIYAGRDYPFMGATTELDISEWDAARQRLGRKFFSAFLHSIMLAMNAIENFRYRIDGDKVFLCEKVDPSFVVFDAEEELHYYALMDMTEDDGEFDRKVDEAKRLALAKRNLQNDNLDVVYVTSTPWFGFTGIIQPMVLNRPDSIPRVVVGKVKREGGAVSVPISITAHHGLVDGFHLSRLLEMIRMA